MNSSDKTLTALKQYALSVAVVSVFLYVFIRTALIDITHDEAYSFYNMKKFWYAEALCTGNTHWLNSAAMKLAIILNFENLLSIRWLSVMSALVICTLVLKWIRTTHRLDQQLLILAVVLCNPYILDYLSIARGYAAGLMLEFLSVFLFVSSVKDDNTKKRFLSLVFAGLSPLANFSYIYFFFAFCIVYFFKTYFKSKRFLKDKNFYRDIVYSFAVAALVARAFLFMTRCSNDVVGAGTDDIKEFFHVFADAFLYLKWTPGFSILAALGMICFCFIFITAVYGVLKASRSNQLYFYSSLLFLLIVLVLIINRLAFHIVYPYYRSAVFLFPVCAVTSICFINEMSIRLRIISYLVSISLIVNFLFSANFKWVLDFKIQCDLKESMDFVESRNAQHVGISPELYGGYRNYHQMTWKYYYNFFGEPINTNLPKGLSKDKYFLNKFDHLILFPPYNLSYYTNNQIKLKGIKLFQETGTLIVKVEK